MGNEAFCHEILCQAEHKKQGRYEGCHRCGGREDRVLLAWIEVCYKCGKRAWVRPAVVTMYDGKEFESYDGVVYHHHMSGNVCQKCEDQEG